MRFSHNQGLRNFIIYSLVLLAILSFIFAVIFLLRSSLTGHDILSLPSTLIPGKPLDGSFELNPSYIGRVVPFNTIVVGTYGDSLRSLYLKDLLSKEYLAKHVQSDLLFAPDVKISVGYYTKAYLEAFPSAPDVESGTSASDPIIDDGDGFIPPGGSGGGKISGHAISEQDNPFYLDFYVHYGFSTVIPSYAGRTPKIYSASLRGNDLSNKYVSLKGNTLQTSYYESLQGIPLDAPSTFFELKKFNFVIKESSPVKISLVYLGQSYFSAVSDVEAANIKPLDFGESDRVLVNSEDVLPEVFVAGDSKVNIVSVGPTVTPDLIAAGCSAYVCGLPEQCSIGSLDSINRGVLVPLQITYCKYTDCGVSFQITKPCQVSSDDVIIDKVKGEDIGLKEDSSNTGDRGSSIAILDKKTNGARAVLTSDKTSAALGITFLQSPPNFEDSCKNGVLDADKGEEDIDCGGLCISCSTKGVDYSISAIWLATGIIGLLFFIFLFRNKSEI